jgi:hypothetical protein
LLATLIRSKAGVGASFCFFHLRVAIMPRFCRIRTVLIFVGLCLLVLSGCGPSGAIVNGKVILPGDVKLTDTDMARLSFIPEGKKGQVYPANVSKSDNTFVAHGTGKRGIPAGKYTIAVDLQPDLGSSDSKKRSALFDPINKKYDAVHSKLTYEVTAESPQSITVDLVKGTVTKN